MDAQLISKLKENGITTRIVAEKMNINKTTVKGWFNGKRKTPDWANDAMRKMLNEQNL